MGRTCHPAAKQNFDKHRGMRDNGGCFSTQGVLGNGNRKINHKAREKRARNREVPGGMPAAAEHAGHQDGHRGREPRLLSHRTQPLAVGAREEGLRRAEARGDGMLRGG